MRSLILSAVLFSAVSVNAQQIVLGLGAGAAVSHEPGKRDIYPYEQLSSKPNVDPAFAFKAGVAQKNTEYGLAVIVSRFSTVVDDRIAPTGPTGDYQFGYMPRVPYRGHNTTYIMANTALTVQFYIDHKFRFGKYDLYLGGAMGQGRFNNIPPTDERVYLNDGKFYAWEDWKTFTTSLEIGGTYHLTKHIGVNAELRGNLIVPYNMQKDEFRYLFSVPLTVGIRYNIF